MNELLSKYLPISLSLISLAIAFYSSYQSYRKKKLEHLAELKIIKKFEAEKLKLKEEYKELKLKELDLVSQKVSSIDEIKRQTQVLLDSWAQLIEKRTKSKCIAEIKIIFDENGKGEHKTKTILKNRNYNSDSVINTYQELSEASIMSGNTHYIENNLKSPKLLIQGTSEVKKTPKQKYKSILTVPITKETDSGAVLIYGFFITMCRKENAFDIKKDINEAKEISVHFCSYIEFILDGL